MFFFCPGFLVLPRIFKIRGKNIVENPGQKKSGAKFCPGKIYCPGFLGCPGFLKIPKNTAFLFTEHETCLKYIYFRRHCRHGITTPKGSL